MTRLSTSDLRWWNFAATVLLVGALAVRLHDLTGVPPFVSGEEADHGIAARTILAGEEPNLFSLGRQGQPNLSFLPYVWSLLSFGNNLWGLRVGAVAIGLVSVALFWRLAVELFRPRTALWGTFVFALLPLHVHYSRIGVNQLQGLVVSQLVLLAVVRTWRSRRRTDFALLGMALALSSYTYLSARIVLIAVPAVFAYLWTVRRSVKWPRLRDWGILVAAFMLASLPMIGHYLDKPESFAGRVEDVVIFSERNWAILTDRAGDEVLDVLRYQASRILNGLFYAEDASSRYNALGGLMGPFLTPLALLGLGLAILRAGEPRFGILLVWVLVGFIVGGILTIGQPYSDRLLVLFPALIVLAGQAIDRMLQFFPSRLRPVLVGSFLIFFGYELIVGYLVAYPARNHVSQMPHTALAALIADVQDDYPVYVVGLPRYSVQSPVVLFLAPRAQAEDLPDEDAKNLARSLSEEAILVVFRDRVSTVVGSSLFPGATPLAFPTRYWQAWIVRPEPGVV